MKCPKCKKDLKEDFLRVYKLGLQDGENQYQGHLNRIEKTFGALFKELQRMDMRTPDKVNCVYLSRQYLNKLIKYMRKYKMNHQANELKNIINKQLGDTNTAEMKMRVILSELQE